MAQYAQSYLRFMKKNEEIRFVLEKYRNVAVIGLSRDAGKDSYNVAKYLKENGYRIIPINPFADEILGEKCFESLLDLPEELQKTVEVVDIFRPARDVPPIVKQAIQLRKSNVTPHVIWMQLGIVNNEAADLARDAGMIVIMNRCMMIEHRKMVARARAREKIRA